ncbi:Hypothetical predicted protein [Podarcis lilfordi]|uniref:Uncharacterized protein n=1 Tax=Podarcis lilfordi TaxID=74358 RepID=A0AA35L984_9SAUR|nr:Hypothetical predicted protein [Podarcis lilfordi]
MLTPLYSQAGEAPIRGRPKSAVWQPFVSSVSLTSTPHPPAFQPPPSRWCFRGIRGSRSRGLVSSRSVAGFCKKTKKRSVAALGDPRPAPAVVVGGPCVNL